MENEKLTLRFVGRGDQWISPFDILQGVRSAHHRPERARAINPCLNVIQRVLCAARRRVSGTKVPHVRPMNRSRSAQQRHRTHVPEHRLFDGMSVAWTTSDGAFDQYDRPGKVFLAVDLEGQGRARRTANREVAAKDHLTFLEIQAIRKTPCGRGLSNAFEEAG